MTRKVMLWTQSNSASLAASQMGIIRSQNTGHLLWCRHGTPIANRPNKIIQGAPSCQQMWPISVHPAILQEHGLCKTSHGPHFASLERHMSTWMHFSLGAAILVLLGLLGAHVCAFFHPRMHCNSRKASHAQRARFCGAQSCASGARVECSTRLPGFLPTNRTLPKGLQAHPPKVSGKGIELEGEAGGHELIGR